MNDVNVLSARTRDAYDAGLDRIRAHPFIVAAERGRLTKEQAVRWILCAGRESRSFPDILQGIIGGCADATVRGILEKNLDDEFGNGDPEHAHFRHYQHLLDKLGIARQVFENYREGAGIGLALSIAYNVAASGRPPLALGYMLVNEGMTPITYTAAKHSLTLHHPGLRTTFFDLHIAVDDVHVADLFSALDRLSPDDLEDVLFGVELGERGMAALLDEALGVFDHADRPTVREPA